MAVGVLCDKLRSRQSCMSRMAKTLAVNHERTVSADRSDMIFHNAEVSFPFVHIEGSRRCLKPRSKTMTPRIMVTTAHREQVHVAKVNVFA